MRQVDIQSVISLLTFMAGAGSAVWGMLQYYSSSEKKKFAAEREFAHLKRDLQGMQLNLAQMMKELDGLGDDMKTHIAVFNAMLNQRGESVSGILGYKKPRE